MSILLNSYQYDVTLQYSHGTAETQSYSIRGERSHLTCGRSSGICLTSSHLYEIKRLYRFRHSIILCYTDKFVNNVTFYLLIYRRDNYSVAQTLVGNRTYPGTESQITAICADRPVRQSNFIHSHTYQTSFIIKVLEVFKLTTLR